MDKRISGNVKMLSFVATCLLVIFHAEGFESANAFSGLDSHCNEFLNYSYKALGYFGLCFFFSVTGFLTFYGLNFKNYLSKISRRLYSLLIPYLIWQLFTLLKDLCIGRRYDVFDVLIRTFGLELWPLDGPLWYVYVTFFLTLFLAPVLLALFYNKKTAWTSTLLVFVLLQLLKAYPDASFQTILNYGLFSRIMLYLPAYMIGAYYGRFFDKDRLLGLMSYSVAVVFLAYVLDYEFGGFFKSMIMMTLPLAIIFILPAMPKLEDKKIYGLSFLIYASHYLFIVDFGGLITYGVSLLPLPVTMLNLIYHLIILVASILLAVMIQLILKKICPKALEIITGGRSA